MGTIRRLILVVLLVSMSAAVADESFDTGDPTADEQMILERVNDIREDHGLQPVVMESRLLAAARAHTADMIDRLFFTHVNPDGRNANGRLLDAGYPLPDDFKEIGKTLEASNTVENVGAITPPDAERILEFLMESDLHKKTILSIDKPAGVDQAGIGIETLGNFVKIGESRLQQFMTQEFARDGDFTPHVLGVVYEDRNGNGEYDAGEGIPGITVRTLTGGFSTTTRTAGGYGMRIGTPGTYDLEASGGALEQPIVTPFTIGSENVRVSFVVDVPETFTLVKSSFKVDFKKRSKGNTEVDSLKLTVRIDPDRVPETLPGSVAEIVVGDRTFDSLTLAGSEKKGTFKSPRGVTPKVKLTVKRSTGTVTLSVKKADLMDDLGVNNETTTAPKSLDVAIRIGSAFDAPGTVTYEMKSTQDKKASGKATP